MQRIPFGRQIDALDLRITTWMARYGLLFLRVALGIIFFWFGALKLVPGLSPAEDLVRNSVPFVDPAWFQPVLALWEMAIGLGLITGLFMRLTLLLLFLQMPGTLLPIFVTTGGGLYRLPLRPHDRRPVHREEPGACHGRHRAGRRRARRAHGQSGVRRRQVK